VFLYFNHKKIVNPELDIKKWENGWVVLDGKIDLGDKEILKILNTLQVEERKEIFEELKKNSEKATVIIFENLTCMTMKSNFTS